MIPRDQWAKSDPRIELKLRNSIDWIISSKGFVFVESQNQKRPQIWTHKFCKLGLFGSFCREMLSGTVGEAFSSAFKGFKLVSRLLTSWMFDWNMGRQTNSLLEMWVGICTVSTSILTKGPLANLSGTCCCSTAVGTLGGNPGSRGLIFF